MVWATTFQPAEHTSQHLAFIRHDEVAQLLATRREAVVQQLSFAPSRFFLDCSSTAPLARPGSGALMRLRLPGQTVFFAVPGAFTPG